MGDLHVRLAGVLDQWVNGPVTVRIVSASDDLLAVFAGTLGSRSEELHPPLFWPVEGADRHLRTVERRGIYVHPDLVSDVRVHTGEFVVEYVQAGVTVNVRRLDHGYHGRRDEAAGTRPARGQASAAATSSRRP